MSQGNKKPALLKSLMLLDYGFSLDFIPKISPSSSHLFLTMRHVSPPRYRAVGGRRSLT